MVGGNPGAGSQDPDRPLLQKRLRTLMFDHGDKHAMSDNNLVPDVILVASDDDNPVPILAHKTVFEQDESSCLGMKLASKSETATGI